MEVCGQRPCAFAIVALAPRRRTIKPSVALPARVTLPSDECSGTGPLTADVSKHNRTGQSEHDTTKEERSGVSRALLALKLIQTAADCVSGGGNNVNARQEPI